MLLGKRDNYESETLKNRQNLHEFLERQAHTAIQGELNSQRKLTEAETVTEVEEWERKNPNLRCNSRNVNRKLHDYNCDKPVNGQIKLNEKGLACVVN